MTMLRRDGARPLLRQVNHKPYATSEDHEADAGSAVTGPISDASPGVTRKHVRRSAQEEASGKPHANSKGRQPQPSSLASMPKTSPRSAPHFSLPKINGLLSTTNKENDADNRSDRSSPLSDVPKTMASGNAPQFRLPKTNGSARSTKKHNATDASSRASTPLSDVPKEVDDEDFTRDPDSSSSEDESMPAVKESSAGTGRALQTQTSDGFSRNIHAQRNRQGDAKLPRAGTKRKQPQQEDVTGDNPDWLTTSQKSKWSRTGTKYGVSSSQRSEKEQKSFKKPKVSSSPNGVKQSRKKSRTSTAEGRWSPQSSQSRPVSSQSGFVHPRAGAPPRSTRSQTGSSQAEPGSSQNDFVKPRTSVPLRGSHPRLTPEPMSSPLANWDSPSASSLSSVEEVWLTGPSAVDETPCPVCEVLVSKQFRDEWELQNCPGRRMNLKLQERFCQAHRLDDAKDSWTRKAYPEIDWAALPHRLESLKPQIDSMLDGETNSSFRHELEEKVKQANTRTAMKAWTADVGDHSRAGYYGAKGAKIMSDFSLKAFDKKLSLLAGEDRVLAVGGVAGGISGFVQAVVVPELTLALIMDDLSVDAEKAREVLNESAALGDTLHAEEEDVLHIRAPTPPPTYGADATVDGCPVMTQV